MHISSESRRAPIEQLLVKYWIIIDKHCPCAGGMEAASLLSAPYTGSPEEVQFRGYDSASGHRRLAFPGDRRFRDRARSDDRRCAAFAARSLDARLPADGSLLHRFIGVWPRQDAARRAREQSHRREDLGSEDRKDAARVRAVVMNA